MNRTEKVTPTGVTDPMDNAPPWDIAVPNPECVTAIADRDPVTLSGLPVVSPSETPSLVPALSLLERAATAARRVVSLLDGANEQHIQAGEIVHSSIAAYRQEPEALKRFVAELVHSNILTRRDGELVDRSTKLVKLATVGEYSGLLRRPEIQQRVRGFSALYQVVVLLKSLPGQGVEQAEALFNILDAGEAQGLISREYLQQATRKIKSDRRAGRIAQPVDAEDRASENLQRLVSEVDLVLMTPTDQDLKRIAETFIDEGSIGLCGRVHERCASSATLVVAVPLHALPLVHDWLSVGFERPRFFLAERADEPDVTDATVIVVATRGPGIFHENIDWGSERDLVQLAEQIVPGAQNRLHVFARESHDGWQGLVGDANWRTDW